MPFVCGSTASGAHAAAAQNSPGCEHDADTGLQYKWARWYDSQAGRWISEDPLGFAAGDANLARYVGNGPIDRLDPSGLVEPWQIPPPAWIYNPGSQLWVPYVPGGFSVGSDELETFKMNAHLYYMPGQHIVVGPNKPVGIPEKPAPPTFGYAPVPVPGAQPSPFNPPSQEETIEEGSPSLAANAGAIVAVALSADLAAPDLTDLMPPKWFGWGVVLTTVGGIYLWELITASESEEIMRQDLRDQVAEEAEDLREMQNSLEDVMNANREAGARLKEQIQTLQESVQAGEYIFGT